MDFAKSVEAPPDMTSTTSASQMSNTHFATYLENIMRNVLGDEVLQLEETTITPFTDAEVRMIRSHTVKGSRNKQ